MYFPISLLLLFSNQFTINFSLLKNVLFHKPMIATLLLLLGTYMVNAQNLNPFKKNSTPVIKLAISDVESKAIINDIIQLSAPNMGSRIMGSTGEQVAITYLTRRFRELSLVEVDKNYQRKFNYSTGQLISQESQITINNQLIRVPSEGYPLPFTGTEKVESYIIGSSNESHSVWVLPAFKNVQESKMTASEKEALLYNKAINAKDRGAWGVVFYNNMGTDFIIPFQQASTLSALDIPVYEISQVAYNEKFKGIKSMTSLNLIPMISQNFKQGVNLYGIMNNGAAKTIVISANYDGYVPENREGEKNLRLPGANNNASGVAALLAIANRLKGQKLNYNVIYILYTGTYKNLLGSTTLFDDKNFFKDKLACAIHLDKVGRLSATKNIFVSGVGTYTAWRGFFSNTPGYDYVLESKGVDASDYQTYLKHKIPYLSFSTGISEDAGTEGDNHAKIKMEGIGEVVNTVTNIINQLSLTRQQINYTEPIEIVSKKSGEVLKVEPTVSLGVIPDLSFKDGGLKISKVNKGQDASNAGLMVGDIIIQIRNFPIQNYDDYLQAMSKFKKGEKTYFRLKRKGNIIQKVVTFS